MNDQLVKALTRAEIEQIEKKQREAERLASIAPPRFVDENRSITVPLSFPMEYDGKVYSSVTVTRPNIRQWRKYMAAVAEAIKVGGEEAGDTVDPPYLDVPGIVYNSLDFADATEVDATVDGFFGRSNSSELTDDEVSGE